MRKMKRGLSLLLALSLVLSYVPVPALAEEGCVHHVHEESLCGYVEPAAGSPCTHVCGEECRTELAEDGVTVLCLSHVCSADDCGYVAEVTGSACTYECADCAAQAAPVCTGGGDCPVSEHNADCAKKLADDQAAAEAAAKAAEEAAAAEKAAADAEAATAVADMIAALPSLEEIQAKPTADQADDYLQVQQVYSAYENLTGDQKALLPPAEDVFKPYFDYFNALAQPAASAHNHRICGSGSCSDSHTAVDWEALPVVFDALTGGYYYLENSRTISQTIKITGNVFLCLNGNTLTYPGVNSAISISGSGSLTICDCGGTGVITNTNTEMIGTGCIYVANQGSLTVYGGKIVSARFYAISMDSTGNLEIHGGTVTGASDAVRVYRANDITVTGGSVTSATGSGIGVDTATFRNLTVSGGYIEGEACGVEFGTVTCSGKVRISGGTLYGKGPVPNATTFASDYHGMSCVGDATIYITVDGGTLHGARGGIYCYNSLANITVSSGTIGSTSQKEAGIKLENGTLNINGGKVYGLRSAGTSTTTVTGGELAYAVASGTSSKALRVYGGTIGRIGSSTSSYGIGTIRSNPQTPCGIQIYGGTVIGTDYAIRSVDRYPYQISGGTLSGGMADVLLWKTGSTVSSACLSLKDYSGEALSVELGSSVSLGSYIAKNVDRSGLITVTNSDRDAYYDAGLKAVQYVEKDKCADGHDYDSNHVCTRCGAIGGTCGTNLTWSFDEPTGTLTISGSGIMADYTATTRPWEIYTAKIRKVALAEGVTAIGAYAFYQCANLEAVTGGTGIAAVYEKAFYDCGKLTGLPGASLRTVGSYAFKNCAAMTQINLQSSMTNDNFGEGAFAGSGLTSVTIPTSVTAIPKYAFDGCTALKTVNAHTSVATINQAAFRGCTSLTGFEIPGWTKNIYADAFANSGLGDIYIGGNVDYVAPGAFAGCTNMKNITVQNNSTYKSFDGVLFQQNGTVLHTYPAGRTGKAVFPYTGYAITGIGQYAFAGCTGITEITVPNQCTSIGSCAFKNCTSLTSFQSMVTYYGAGITTIGNMAFEGCTALETINLPAMTQLNNSLFKGCTALKEVTISERVTQVQEFAFDSCTVLAEVYFGGSSYKWNNITIGSRNDPLNAARKHYSVSTPATHWSLSGKEATCIADGYSKETCPCGYTRNEVTLPATGVHQYNLQKTTEAYLVSAATCASAAVYNKSCVCGKAGTETFTYGTTDPTNHNFVKDVCSGCDTVKISETTFPDETFRNYIKGYPMGQDNLLTREERTNMTRIDVSMKAVKDLSGIAYFPALVELICYGNQLTELDVSRNPALKKLYCGYNQLTELDVSSNPALESLYCDTNQLTSLDVTHNPALSRLECYQNHLTELDVSKNPQLFFLYASHNQLKYLDVSQNPLLEYLYCSGNQLKSLDVSSNPELYVLVCGSNQLKSLDVSSNCALYNLTFDGNQLKGIDLSQNPALAQLDCENNQLTSLDVSGNPKLEYLHCSGNQLLKLDVSKNTALRSLRCNDNQLTNLDLSCNSGLWTLECSGNVRTVTAVNGRFYLSNLEEDGFAADKATEWTGGKVSGTVLTATAQTVTYTYDVGQNKTATFALQIEDACANGHKFDAQTMNSDTLKTPATCTSVAVYYYSCSVCGTNDTKTFTYGKPLDHTFTAEVAEAKYLKSAATCTEPAVYYYSCSTCGAAGTKTFTYGSAKSHDFSAEVATPEYLHTPATCLGLAVYYFSCSTCGETGTQTFTYGTANPENHKFVEDVCACGAVKISELTFPDANFRSYVSSSISGSKDGVLTSKELADVTSIAVSNKNIASLTGVAYFTELEELSCFCNQLTSLDLSQNTALTSLSCSNNQLKHLDVSSNPALTGLICDNNQLRSLNVSNNSALVLVNLNNNELTSLDLSNRPALKTLKCTNNKLTILNVTGNAALQSLYCSDNQLTKLDLSGAVALKQLGCDKNQLTTLDVSNSTALEYLNCGNNQLVSLDLSGNTVLTSLYCANNSRTVSVTNNRFDLSSLEADGFVLSKVYNWMQGEVHENVLTAKDNEVGYRYDLGNRRAEVFTLKIEGLCTNGHDFSRARMTDNYLKSPATCTDSAVYYYSCTACGEKGTETFTDGELLDHTFTGEVVKAEYLKTAATCTAPAVYFKSCAACGEKGSETFTYGKPLDHSFTAEVAEDKYLKSAATCTASAVYFKSCSVCGEKGTETFTYGKPLDHTFTGEAAEDKYLKTAATCTEPAVYFKSCSVCGEKGTETFTYGKPLDHTFDRQVVAEAYLASPATVTSPASYFMSCVCGAAGTETFEHGEPLSGTRILTTPEELAGAGEVWVDGVRYTVQTEGDLAYVDLPEGARVSTMITYGYHVGDPNDVHTQYPISMQVWKLLAQEDGNYTVSRIRELDDILQYSGSSIRITGKKGIRMITSVEKAKKDAMISGYLGGYRLLEYGTVLALAGEMEGGKPLILGESYARSNYAYKRDVADPVFAYSGSLVQYTNVLVGFTLDQCAEDIAMRSYMILEDENGSQITLYGGTVYRSIGYIAYQNRTAFAPGTGAYNYVWEIIHHVYGDRYDADYKG